ncbi:Phosphoglycolate phosphatase 2 [Eumeta japonica]|uniref:Phosphoglycolate phosphatase 2 n=1 Tax=Eumeta variegata TaxID=151549 RepID=A0A4C1SIH9_EUMVA|nr:Phosphoglycolate phosphatase 2 [Eumeta japonica]
MFARHIWPSLFLSRVFECRKPLVISVATLKPQLERLIGINEPTKLDHGRLFQSATARRSPARFPTLLRSMLVLTDAGKPKREKKMVQEPVELQKLSVEDFKKFLSSFDHVFSDCDGKQDLSGEDALATFEKGLEDISNTKWKCILKAGVIWTRQPLPRVGEFFSLMGELGKTVHFVSNNSIRSRKNYEDMFKQSGIENGYEKLTHPAIAIAEYLKSINFDKQIYCVTCQETIRTLESHGFKCKYGPDVGQEYYQDFVEYLEDDLDVGAVVFDSDFKINLPKLYKAITYLKRPEVLFINGASDRRVPMKNGLSLDRIQRRVPRIVGDPIVSGQLDTLALRRDVASLYMLCHPYEKCSEELFNLMPATDFRYGSLCQKYHQHHFDGWCSITVCFIQFSATYSGIM